jgi:hypothetical protein
VVANLQPQFLELLGVVDVHLDGSLLTILLDLRGDVERSVQSLGAARSATDDPSMVVCVGAGTATDTTCAAGLDRGPSSYRSSVRIARSMRSGRANLPWPGGGREHAGSRPHLRGSR